jgi:hypothetical protein
MPDPVETTAPVAAVPPVPEPIVLPSEAPKEKLLAGKYKTVEELEKGYNEIQKLVSGKKPATEPPADSAPPPDPSATPEAAVAKAGLDMAVLTQEFSDTGALSEASLKALEGVGIPKDVVDTYIAGQQALIEQAVGKVHALAGGKETFDSMLEWAKANIPEEEKVAFNSSMTGDINAQKLAVDALKAKYVKAVGSNPKIIVGEGAPPVGQGYESRAQMVADMKDPRYAKDPAYRAKVAEKLNRTTVF